MKDFLQYYKASKKNKIKVFAGALGVYLLLYIASNPYVYWPYFLHMKIALTEAIDAIKSQRIIKTPSPTVIITPTPFLKSGSKISPGVENMNGQ